MFTLPGLPYSFSALEPHLDAATLEIHHGRHHAAYVKNLNDVLPDRTETDLVDILSNLNDLPENVRVKVQNNGGGHYNHTLYWTSMSAKPALPSKDFSALINSAFGSLDILKEKMTASALGRFGSGWAWLVLDNNNLAIMDTANQDTPLALGRIPLLGLDVWEHAYYLKYQNRRADYIAAWWNVVNWTEVSVRFAHS